MIESSSNIRPFGRIALITLFLSACRDSGIAPATLNSGLSASISAPLSAWTGASAKVSVTQEIMDVAIGSTAAGRSLTRRYSINETRASAGWRARVVKLAAQPGDMAELLQRPASGRNLSHVEIDANGEAKAFSIDGSQFPRARTDSAAWAESMRNARKPSWYTPKLRAVLPVRSAPERPSVIAGLVVQRDSSDALRHALARRYGVPTRLANGDEQYRIQIGDTIRTISYRPAVGAVSSIHVEIGGRLASQTDYEFSPIEDGVMARTRIRTVRGVAGRTESGRLSATTIEWSDIRVNR